MKPRLLFATTNAGKLRELRGLVGDARGGGLPQGPAAHPRARGDGATFEENAELKARAYAEASGLPALADDSGLCVDALGGRPGVHSARYAEGDDQARYQKLLAELSGVPDDQRTAAFSARSAWCGRAGAAPRRGGPLRGAHRPRAPGLARLRLRPGFRPAGRAGRWRS